MYDGYLLDSGTATQVLHGQPIGIDSLNPGDGLTPGQSMVSRGGKYELALQTDGNLVLYNLDPAAHDKVLWSTGTVKGCVGMLATLQADGNFVLYGPANRPCWSSQTAGKNGVSLIVQDDGNLVLYNAQHLPVWSTETTGGRRAKKSGGSVFAKIGHDIGKIPVVGPITKIADKVALEPVHISVQVASGERLDHVAIGTLKDQIKTVKDVAPYATTVVSFVPGVGTGVAAAIGAGAALAEGKSIASAVKAGVRDALPGGPVAAAAFDTALKVAGGQNVARSALESSRALLPPGPAQTAFDIGLAVATGEKLQGAITVGLVNMAPEQLQTVVTAGQQAVATTPGLSEAFKSVAPGDQARGFHLAAGLLSHEGMNERSMIAFRSRLSREQIRGFDAALRAQAHHIAWLNNVIAADVSAGAAPQPISASFSATYAPYPQQAAGLSGCFNGSTDPSDPIWGPAVTDMPKAMDWAGRSAVNGSKGRSRVVQGPDGVDYLFSMENGVLTARPRVSL